MELREWALSILESDELSVKLAHPLSLTDDHPDSAIVVLEPARKPHMKFKRCSKEDKLPSFHEHRDPEKRAVCLHRFAGHELLAVEIMAFTLLAFPHAPRSFRRGVAYTLKEEQEHVRLYIKRMKELGIEFGDLPLYRHFWKHTPYIQSPLDYICMMSLTFEMANLDFAPMYGQSFARNGDHDSAKLMAQILKDEISHVGFGWNWLKNLKGQDKTEWKAWEEVLSTTLLTPKRAKGFQLHEEPRLQAGIPKDWIDQLKRL